MSDKVLAWALRACGIVSGAVVLLIMFFLMQESLPALQRLGLARFFTDASWHPAADASQGRFNITAMVSGTLLTTAGAVLLAAPLGVVSAVFSHYYAPPRVARVHRRLIELLAGIPSVVYGFWGLVSLVPLLNALHPPGQSLLAGIVVLAIMILPTVALLSDAALANVPRSYLDGAAALGLTRWRTVWGVALPAARSGLFTGVLLATARAVGETMAVLMVCGNVVRLPGSVFDPVRTLTANIALEMAYAMGDHRSALFVSGLTLMGLVVLLVAAAGVFSRERVYA